MISELRGEEALEALADMLEPAMEIMSDVHFVASIRNNDKLKAVQIVLKKHKKAIINILALSEGKKPEEYEVGIMTLPLKLMKLVNDPEVMSLFQSQGQMNQQESSGSAMENIEGNEK